MEWDLSRVELISPLGRVLYALVDHEGAIEQARAAVDAAPDDLDRLLALGGAQVAVWRFQDAVATYTRAVERWPEDHRTWQLRGHRLITIRHVALARRDLERAARIGPPGFDTLYHLGHTFYLEGDFARAAALYRECLEVCRPEQVLATADWLYMALRRAGQVDEAAALVRSLPLDTIDYGRSQGYYNRLRVYRGDRAPETLLDPIEDERVDVQMLTQAYGLGNYYLYNGERERALALFRDVVGRDWWPAFAFIAAEVELLRAGAA